MMNRKLRKSVYDAIAQLNRMELDTPISIEGDVYERRVFKQLETLRKSMRDARDTSIAKEEKNKVAMASVVHDLKTPLAVISGYAESLDDGMNDKDYISLIIKKTAEMNTQVLSLVESSKQEIQGYKTRKESILVSDFFKTEAEKYEPLAKEKKIKYVIGTAPYDTIYVNRDDMARVLQNLISNSIKYTRYNGRISVKAHRVAKEIRFIIKDNGEGIAPESLPFIFDKFYMEDKSRSSGNNGLGLYIANNIVTEHQGVIDVKSKKGKGSTFTVRIPVEDNGKIRPTITERFNALPHNIKMLIFIFLGVLMTSLYRFQKFYETRKTHTLIAAFLLIPLCLLGWIADVFSLAVANEITLVAD